jgi:hypothetical protein
MYLSINALLDAYERVWHWIDFQEDDVEETWVERRATNDLFVDVDLVLSTLKVETLMLRNMATRNMNAV